MMQQIKRFLAAAFLLLAATGAHAACDRSVITSGSSVAATTFATDVDEEVECLWNQVSNYLTGVTGTNSIEATGNPDLGAYAAGQIYLFKPAADNTGAVVINIDGLGDVDVETRDGSALSGGELLSDYYYLAMYDTDGDVRLLSEIGTGSDYRIASDAVPGATSSYEVSTLAPCRNVEVTFQLQPATDDQILRMRISDDNGVSYESGAADYGWVVFQVSSGGTDSDVDTSDSEIQLSGEEGVGNGSSEWISGTLRWTEFNQAEEAQVEGVLLSTTAAGTKTMNIVTGWDNAATARSGIQFSFASGNIADGYVRIMCHVS